MTPSKADRAAAFINGGKSGFRVYTEGGRWRIQKPRDLARLAFRAEVIKLAEALGWKDGEE